MTRAAGSGGSQRDRAVLVLDDGRVFTGTPFGAVGETLGEAVFSTGMSGYQETLTDPSYHRQIVVATAPQIGNTGWNGEDAESRGDRIWVAGYAVRDPSPRPSNWRATGTLDDELTRQGIVGIAGPEARAAIGGSVSSSRRPRPTLASRCSSDSRVFCGCSASPSPLAWRISACAGIGRSSNFGIRGARTGDRSAACGMKVSGGIGSCCSALAAS